jgi:hypothetical protein
MAPGLSKVNRQQRYRKKNPKIPIIGNARQRAKYFGVPCTIKPEDFEIPKFCPALGIKLTHGSNKKSTPNSPSLDRLIPSKGYVKGNVTIISKLANSIKSSASSPNQVRLVYLWLKKKMKNK